VKRKNYIIFIRHLRKIKGPIEFYEYIADSKFGRAAIYLSLLVCAPFIALLFPIAYIEHCIYKTIFIRECIKNKWCLREHFEDVIDIRKIESEELEDDGRFKEKS